ncbi:hypothetical protein AB0G85_33065 [Streptomyces sioyaensis]|uniref:hypothetical protein n=1 Tax=Streptomyces sioyaensis TaxID=67364 RepID=UPI0033EB6484
MSVNDPYDELMRHLGEAKERFTADVRDAEMTVLKDEGIYRHLTFSFPKASWSWCEVVTWPHMLVLRGDLGCWSFSRVEDMFDFFREPEDVTRMDPSYWAEKLVPGGRDSAKEYSGERAAAYVVQTMEENAAEHPDLSKDAQDVFFTDADLSTETGLREAVARFDERFPAYAIAKGFRFPVEQWDLHRYSPWFLLACVVLPWTIEQYDTARVPVA